MARKKRKKKGFTLVELLVTIAILGILVGISIPLIRNIQGKLVEKRYTTYIESLVSGAKIYMGDSAEDVFGHKVNGCGYVTFSDLKKRNLAKDIKLSGITCDTNKTYVKVIKFNEKYYYTGFIGCGDKNNLSGDLPIIRPHAENPETICDSSSESSMIIVGSPESSNLNTYKLKRMTADIRTYSGISLTNMPKIWYGFSYNKDHNVIEGWDTLKYPGISSLTEEEQLRYIQTGNPQIIKSNKVNTPEGKTGDFYLVVKVDVLEDLGGANWTTGEDKYLYLGPYRADNSPPIFNAESSVISSTSSDGYNNLKPQLNLNVQDIYDGKIYSTEDEMKMCVTFDSETACGRTKADISNYSAYKKDKVLGNISNSYNGSTHKVYVTVVDAAGNFSETKEFNYRVSQEYTLTYNSDGGSTCSPTNKKQYENLGWGNLCTPTKDHYVFKGWYTAKNGGGTNITKDTKATSDLTVYAKWDVATYTLTYDANGGTACSPASKSVTYNNKWGNICSPSRTNYTFLGWNTKKDGSGTTVTKDSLATSNLTVYAQWTTTAKTLSYDKNNGTGGTTANTTCNYNQNCTVRTNGYTRTGYTFTGWNTKADGKGTSYANGANIVITTDTKLYAQWRVNKVIIKLKWNTGETIATPTTSGGVTRTWGKNSSNVITVNGSEYSYSINRSTSASMDLANYNNPGYVNITKAHYTGKSGAEWICDSGCKTAGKTFNQNAITINTQDICNTDSGDCTVYLKVNWRPNVAHIQYNTNSNSAVVRDTPAKYKKINNYQVVNSSNNRVLQNITYGVSASAEQHNLYDYHNNDWLYIQKTASNNGTAKSGEQWHKADGSNCARTTYNQSTDYTADQYCDTTNGDCTCTVRVNWQ